MGKEEMLSTPWLQSLITNVWCVLFAGADLSTAHEHFGEGAWLDQGYAFAVVVSCQTSDMETSAD